MSTPKLTIENMLERLLEIQKDSLEIQKTNQQNYVELQKVSESRFKKAKIWRIVSGVVVMCIIVLYIYSLSRIGVL